MKKLLLGFFLGIVVVMGVVFFVLESRQKTVEKIPKERILNVLENEENKELSIAQKEGAPQEGQDDAIKVIFVDQKVPFVVQAPGGSWNDSRRQDGCEEASMLMAMRWVEGKDIIDPVKELNKVSLDMEQRLGTFQDTSMEDTFSFVRELLQPGTVVLKKDVAAQDMRDAILSGNILAATVNGQKLHNPYFTPPGPEYHMLIIRGYDPATGEFLTNDPGTIHGEGYRYKTDVLFGAMQDYETGHHKGVHPEKKSMMVFLKKYAMQ